MTLKKYINVYDKNFDRVAVLENADNISYSTKMNSLWTARFRLPSADPKNAHCKAFNYVELFDDNKRVEIFRIMPTVFTKDQSSYISYDCEHVLSTLLDTVLFGYHQVGNVGVFTSSVLRYILNRQSIWRLGVCDFSHQFEYKWENENLLAALFSVAQPFSNKYIWTFDTTSRPFILNLKIAEQVPNCEIRYKKNMTEIEKTSDPSSIVTRLYCLGYGEGDNQLNIKSVNNQLPYLEASKQYTNMWGIRESIWIDRRYESPETLKAAGLAYLNELKSPYITYRTKALQLSSVTNSEYDEFRAGKLVNVVDSEDSIQFIAYITDTNKTVSNPDVDITISNKERDIASTISELQSRTRISESYAQGSTNIFALNYADNADINNPAVMKFYVPAETVRINKCILSISLDNFRAFSKSISSSEQSAATSSSGGGGSSTSSGGGGDEYTTSDGGATTQTSGADNYSSSRGGHNHGIDRGERLLTSGGGYVSWVPSGDHEHDVEIPDHRHDMFIGDHTHDIELDAHTHDITIPGHTHDIEFGIFRGTIADSVIIRVDGNIVTQTVNTEIDIVPYISKDADGRINRGVFHTIEIYPNKLTRIVGNLFLQTFLNSRGAGDY